MLLQQLLAHRSRQIRRCQPMNSCEKSMERHMQTTDQIRKKEKEYGARAMEFVGKMEPNARKNLPTIKPGSAEWKAWESYFTNHLGFYPWAMNHVTRRHLMDETDAAMTVPTQWPEWFDTSYSSVQAAE